MAEVVDSIIARLEVNYQQYVDGFDKATAAHDRFTKSVPGKSGIGQAFSSAEVEQYANRHKKAVVEIGDASEKSADRVKKAAKSGSDAQAAAAKVAEKAQRDLEAAQKRTAAAEEKAAQRAATASAAEKARSEATIARLRAEEAAAANQAKASAFLTPSLSGKSARDSGSVFSAAYKAEDAAAKASAKEADASARATEKAEREKQTAMEKTLAKAERIAAREAQLDENAKRRTIGTYGDNPGLRPARNSTLGATVPNVPYNQPSIPAAVLNGAGAGQAEVAAAKEVDALTADIATRQASLTALQGAEKRDQQDIIAGMRLEKQLRAAGVADEEILVRLETRRVALAAERAVQDRKQALSGASKFAEGAGIGRTGGTGAAVAGIGTAIAAAAVVSAVDSAVARGKEIAAVSAQLGVSTKQLQVYEAAALRVGVTNEQVRTSFGQLQNEIGKAKEGDQTAGKAFQALGVDIKSVGSAGDVLPTLIDRLSSIKDPAQRAAIETKLFGEEGRKLDGLLAGGNQRIDELSAALERTGAILSDPDIRNLDKTAAKLEAVKNQLGADIAGVVAGNADAIQTLAGAFANLASNVLKYAAAQDRAAAASILKIDPSQRDIPTMAIGALGGKSRAQQVAQARSLLLQSDEGRKILLDQNRQSIRRAALDVPLENGRDTPAVQAMRAQRIAPLVEERKAIYEAGRQQARAEAPPKVQAGKVDTGLLSRLNAPKPATGPKGKSEDQIAKESESRLRRFQDQLARLQEDQLRAEQDLTGDIQARARIESELAERALTRRLEDIESQRKTDVLNGESSKVAAARAATLSAEARKATLADQAVIEQRRQIDTNIAITEHLQQSLSSQAGLLDSQLGLAKTAKERLSLELELLENAKKQDRAGLQRQLQGLKPGDPARQDVQAQIDGLDRQYAGREAVTRRQNQGPLASYREGYNDPATQVQQAVADKLKSVDDAITNAASKVLGVKDPLLKSLLQIFLQQNVLKPLYDAMQGAQGGGGGGIGGLLGTVAGLFGGGHSLGGQKISGSLFAGLSKGNGVPGFASGGSLTIGGNPGVDQNELSLNGKAIARVGQGEVLSVSPNVAASNRPVQGRVHQTIVQQSFTLDARGGITTPQLLDQVNQIATQRAAQAGRAAYSSALSDGAVQQQRRSVLGNS